jgi:hypothetical protein
MAKILKPEHSHHQRLEKLFAFMIENKISITIGRYGNAFVKIDDVEYTLEDLEGYGNEPFSDFPPIFDFKLAFDRDVSR